jgi:hypothetical protein
MFAEAEVPSSKPRTRAFNAYRHGLTGHVLVIEPADQVAYDKHCRGIRESLAPSGALETDLVQSVADDRWRLKRAAAIESNIFALGLNEPDHVTAHNGEIDTALAMARTWLESSKDIQLLALYESRIQRRVEKNLALVRQMQQDRRNALQQAAEEVRLLAQLAASKGESFDPAQDFPTALLPAQFDFSDPKTARLVAHLGRLAEAKKQFPAAQKSLRHAA